MGACNGLFSVLASLLPNCPSSLLPPLLISTACFPIRLVCPHLQPQNSVYSRLEAQNCSFSPSTPMLPLHLNLLLFSLLAHFTDSQLLRSLGSLSCLHSNPSLVFARVDVQPYPEEPSIITFYSLRYPVSLPHIVVHFPHPDSPRPPTCSVVFPTAFPKTRSSLPISRNLGTMSSLYFCCSH
jgi:hypothetical protein